MRTMALIYVFIFSLFIVTGCKAESDKYKSQLEEKESKIKALESDKAEAERLVDNLRKENDKLSKQLSQLGKSKELGAVEITNAKWSEKEKDFQIILTGTVKNTGLAYLRDVTVKVTLMDETGNPLVIPLINDPCERESETMRLFHHVADSLGTGDSKDFQMIIYTHLFHGDGKAKIRAAIENPKLYEIVGLFVSAK